MVSKGSDRLDFSNWPHTYGTSSPSCSSGSQSFASHASEFENGGFYEEEESLEAIPPLSSSPPEFRSSSPCNSSPDGSPAEHNHKPSDDIQMGSEDIISQNYAFGKVNGLLKAALREHVQLKRATPETPVANYNIWRNSKSCGSTSSKATTTQRKSPFVPLPTIIDEEDVDFVVDEDDFEAVSPMSFAPATDFSPFLNENLMPKPAFRIIKRASSYTLIGTPDHRTASKVQKLGHDPFSHARTQPYARRAASLRRAESLKTITDGNSPLIPTAPATPAPSHLTSKAHRKCAQYSNMPDPVPIIAPPMSHLTGLPLCTETLSKMRVKRFLERDACHRKFDAITPTPFLNITDVITETCIPSSPPADGPGGDARTRWEVRLGIGRVQRLNAINWMLDVMPTTSSTNTPSSSHPSLSSSQSTLSSQSENEAGEHTHQENIRGIDNLHDQLSNSHETRFHACWIFLRYFYATMSSDSPSSSSRARTLLCRSSSLDSQSSGETERQGRDLIIWDIAVACLSLSVKLHRDFLDPLLPVFAHEYLYLSPHAMSYDNLEFAHRDVLSALDYSLGHSPQLLMDELWLSLPSLRSLLDFEGGWSHALEDAWMFLLDAVCEPDVQRFSIPVLTTVAILDGIIESLVHHYRSQYTDSPPCSPSVSDKELSPRYFTGQRLKQSRELLEHKAGEEAEGVLCDIQELVGVSDPQVNSCRTWMKTIQPLV